MAGSGDELIERIRESSDIVDVVAGYLPLKKAGNSFKGLCPFHREKTPSFFVNPARQFFYCFGCGAGGDVFRFVMEYEKVDFLGAARLLAAKAGIAFEPSRRGAGGGADKAELYAVNEKALQIFQDCLLKKSEGEAARRYLKGRGFTSAVAREFGIGFAPDRWDTLSSRLGQDFQRAAAEAAGLIIKDAEGGGYHDRFRNRVMFAVHDEQGRVAGFSGRVLGEAGEAAKYVNTPDTPVFHKGKILYAFHRARRAVAETRQAVICEGQIDVIRCHLAGFANAVAAQGTAFGEDHARAVARYAEKVVLVFDADDAGRKAALRTAQLFIRQGIEVRVALLPQGEDPDSLIRSAGADRFKELLEGAVSALQFQYEMLAATLDLKSQSGLVKASSEMLVSVGMAPNEVQRSVLLAEAAFLLGVGEKALRAELRKTLAKAGAREPAAAGTAGKTPTDRLRAAPPRELALVEQLVMEPGLCGLVKQFLPLRLISDEMCRDVLRTVISAAEKGENVFAALAAADDTERNFSRIAAEASIRPRLSGGLVTAEEYVKSLILEIHKAELERRRENTRKKIAELRAKLRDGEDDGKVRRMEMECLQMACDIAGLKSWESAVDLLKALCYT